MESKTVWIINQYASTLDTGMGGRHYYFAKELADLGHSVYLVGASYHHLLKNQPVVTNDIDIQRVEGFNYVWVKLPKYNNAHSLKRILNWFLFSFRLRLLKNKIAEKPDTIVVSSPSLISYLGARHLSKYFKSRLILDIRDIWPLTLKLLGGYSERHPFIKFLQQIEDKACREVDFVVSNWPYADKHLAERGLRPELFEWVPNGFSMDEFSQVTPLDSEFLNAVPSDKFIVGYTGTLGKANAIDTLLDTAERLLSNPNIIFLVVGGGKEADDFIAEVSRRNLRNILYMGLVDKQQIPAVLSLVDVCYVGFCNNPLYKYGNSLNKLPEYFASKKPIVYSINSPFKPVEIANAGLTVGAEDPGAISKAILKLFNMGKEERIELGRNGFEYALKEHEYKALAKKMEGILFDGV